MRRAVSLVTVVLGLLGATVAFPAVALAAPVSPSAAVTPGKKKCTVEDPRLRELSGMVATKTGYIVINDSSDQDSRKRVFYLDATCQIAKDPVRFSGQGPFDTEDLALSPDGRTLWIADTGDNATSKQRRERVAVWSMPVGGTKQPVLHRLSYPERQPHDAEALLISADGKPLVITKVAVGKAEIFTPTAELKTGDTDPVPMKKVGEIALPKTDTDNLFKGYGRVAITGAAAAPDGSRVVLRTYADAFEYDVTGGDVLAALTTGKPRVTPLADPFGEAISYTPDGKSFVTVSDAGQLAQDESVDILGYTPSTTSGEGAPAKVDTAKAAAEKSWTDSLSLQQITYLIAAVGVIGALLVGAGIIGIVRARRNPAPTGSSPDGLGGPDRSDEFPLGAGPGERGPGGPPPGGGRPRGGVYGGAPAGGGVYGGRPAPPGGPGPAPAGGGAVYGGGRPPAGGGVYGGGRPAASGGYGGDQAPGGGVYGGARAEPPRGGDGNEEHRGQRSGPRRDGGGYDDDRGGQYGQMQGGGRGYRGDRY
jgi:hypothetical protein